MSDWLLTLIVAVAGLGLALSSKRSRGRCIVVALGLCVSLVIPVSIATNRVRQFGWGYILRFEPFYSPDSLDPLQRRNGNAATTGQGGEGSKSKASVAVAGVEFWSDSGQPDDDELSRVFVRDRDGTRQLLGKGGELDGFAFVSVERGDCDGGRPYVFLAATCEGPHSCMRVWVFSIEDGAASFVTRVESGNHGAEILDLDGDGCPEVQFPDDVFAYWRASYAESPAELVRLSLQGRAFQVAQRLMLDAIPDRATRVAAVQNAFLNAFLVGDADQTDSSRQAVPVEVWALALGWIYRGHGDETLEALAAGWPPGRADYASFERRFLARLSRSRWIEGILATNGETEFSKKVVDEGSHRRRLHGRRRTR